MTLLRLSSLSSSRPLPFLPIELKRSILTLADTQSLGRCCRVSFVFLEVASELLYRDVDVEGYERLKRMFCTREECSSAQVSDFLSLRRIKNFTFLLDAFSLGIPALLFNPVRFAFISPTNTGNRYHYLDLEAVAQTKSWTRLSQLRIVNAGTAFWLSSNYFGSSRWTISFELSHPFIASNQVPTEVLGVIKQVLLDQRRHVASFPDEVLQVAEVVVESEEEKAQVDAFLREQPQMTPAEIEERMKHIFIVVRGVSF